MPNISIIADQTFVDALLQDPDLPLQGTERVNGTVAESERLGFELGSIVTVIGGLVAGVEAISLARSLYKAARKTKNPRLELVSPNGRVTLDLEGKTDEEIAQLIRAALPFTR